MGVRVCMCVHPHFSHKTQIHPAFLYNTTGTLMPGGRDKKWETFLPSESEAGLLEKKNVYVTIPDLLLAPSSALLKIVC